MLSKKIVTISEYTKSDVSHHLKVNPQKLELIYNPIPKEIINNENYYEKSNDKILIVGTSSNKNIETIFYAVKDLNIQLIIIGKLTQNHILILQELNISYHNVYDLEYSKVLDFYKQVDLVVFISKHEGFGMPIIEANALGTPIIVSSIPPLKEIGLDAVYYIKDENDFNEVRDAIKLLLSNDKLKNDLIQRGKDNIVRFNPKNIAAKYIQIYNSI
jgi:glycosyltransferase involved in cell wall biosynthesis